MIYHFRWCERSKPCISFGFLSLRWKRIRFLSFCLWKSQGITTVDPRQKWEIS